jgi:pyruvate formate lyase activating enzyme
LYENGFDSTPLHFSRFHPTYKLQNLPPTPFDILNQAYSIAKESGLKYVYVGNVPAHPSEHTRCPSCNEIVIRRRGFKVESFNLKDSKCLYCEEKVEGVWN